MAINSFSQGVTPSALPLPVTTASATTSATTTDITVSWTPDSKGSVPTTYSVVGTATSGVTTNASTTSTSVTVSKQSGGRAYSFAVTAQNRFGNSATATSSSAVTPPFVYKEAITTTSTVNYTIPTGYSKMAAIVYGGGGNGSAGITGEQSSGYPGKGGGGAGAVAFQEYSISATQVYTLTVAAAGGQSKITAPDTTIIASANGGAQGGNGAGTNAGGTATSQVATNATITGGTGGGGAAGFVGSSTVGQAGGNASATSFTVLTGYALPASVAVALGGGGGGGTGRRCNDPGYGEYQGSNAVGGSGGTGGATGQQGGDNGSYPAGRGYQGAGGGGGGFAAGSGTSGGVGRVVVYVA